MWAIVASHSDGTLDKMKLSREQCCQEAGRIGECTKRIKDLQQSAV